MRQDNSRFFRSPFLVRCYFEQLNLFGKNTLGNGFSVGCCTEQWHDLIREQIITNYLLSYPLYLRSNPLCGIAKSRNDWT